MLKQEDQIKNMVLLNELKNKDLTTETEDAMTLISQFTFLAVQSGATKTGSAHYSSFLKNDKLIIDLYLTNNAYHNQFNLEQEVIYFEPREITFITLLKALKEEHKRYPNIDIQFHSDNKDEILCLSYGFLVTLYLNYFANIQYSDTYLNDYPEQKDTIYNVFNYLGVKGSIIEMRDDLLNEISLMVVLKNEDMTHKSVIEESIRKINPELEDVYTVTDTADFREFLMENEVSLKPII